MSKLIPKRCPRCDLQDRGPHVHRCPRLVDLADDDNVIELGDLISVRCKYCQQFTAFDRARVRTFAGKGFLSGPCDSCVARIEVQLLGWVCSGGGDLSRGGQPDNYTRSGRGPSPGHLPGHN